MVFAAETDSQTFQTGGYSTVNGGAIERERIGFRSKRHLAVAEHIVLIGFGHIDVSNDDAPRTNLVLHLDSLNHGAAVVYSFNVDGQDPIRQLDVFEGKLSEISRGAVVGDIAVGAQCIGIGDVLPCAVDAYSATRIILRAPPAGSGCDCHFLQSGNGENVAFGYQRHAS